MFIELFFIFSAIWENQYYYLFGFLFLVFIIIISKYLKNNWKSLIILFVVSCSQISIVITYFQLCGEDYHWWWRSFIASGGSAFYVFAYSIFYFFTKVIRIIFCLLWNKANCFLLAWHNWICSIDALFWLYILNLFHILDSYWYNWFYCIVHFC